MEAEARARYERVAILLDRQHFPLDGVRVVGDAAELALGEFTLGERVGALIS